MGKCSSTFPVFLHCAAPFFPPRFIAESTVQGQPWQLGDVEQDEGRRILDPVGGDQSSPQKVCNQKMFKRLVGL